MNIETILWVVFGVSTILYFWVGKSFISQPDYNVPMIFRNPVAGKILVLAPQLGFLAVAILGFVLTDSGWWYLGAVIAAAVILSSRPQPF